MHACRSTLEDPTITTGGGAKCWGVNGNGQLGNGGAPGLTPTNVIGLDSGVAAIATGHAHALALTTDGAVKTWGYGFYGQLGDGTFNSGLTPSDPPALSSGFASIAAGFMHSCAVTTGGAAKCWGRNSSGELGDGTATDRGAPVDVVGLTSGVVAIAAGEYHTCALMTGGGVKCWGANNYGQLGDSTTAQRLTPVNVGEIGAVAQIRAGAGHTCALLQSGGVMCWGRGDEGQMGNGGTTAVNTVPVNVTGLAGINDLGAGGYHTCAVDSVGALTCWGLNLYGQLGDGTTTARSLPTPVPGLTGLFFVVAGNAHTCVLFDGGGVKCWGDNTWGQVGDGTTGGIKPTPTLTLRDTQSILLPAIGPLNYAVSQPLVPDVSGGPAGGSWTLQPQTGSTCDVITAPNLTGTGAGLCAYHVRSTGSTDFYPARTERRLLVTGPSVARRFMDSEGDGRSDIVWRNSSSGLNYVWHINGLGLSDQGYTGSAPPSWSIAAIGDTNGDARMDVLWREASTGSNYLWLMNGRTIAGQAYLASVPAPWIVVGMGDANANGGRTDIFWRNPTTGQNYLWLMDGLNVASQGFLLSVVNPDWEIAAIADFNGDARADILWRNKTTGYVYLWMMNGLFIAVQGYLPTVPTDWEVVATPDADADGRADVFWRNKTTGQVYLWLMDGLAIHGQGYLTTVGDLNWKVAAWGDYDGDGYSDILWRNATSGQNYVWLLRALSIFGEGYLPVVAGPWQPAK